MADNTAIAGGFPQYAASAEFVDANRKLSRDALYLLQLLWQRTGGVSSVVSSGVTTNNGTPIFLDTGGDSGEEPFFVPAQPGQQGIAGPAGPAIFLDSTDAPFDESLLILPKTLQGGWFDEKGSGGTYGFAAGVDFTAGTTTSLTLSNNYGAQANLIVAFDAATQGADSFSLSGKTLTFTSAIPVGVSKVYVKGFVFPG